MVLWSVKNNNAKWILIFNSESSITIIIIIWMLLQKNPKFFTFSFFRSVYSRFTDKFQQLVNSESIYTPIAILISVFLRLLPSSIHLAVPSPNIIHLSTFKEPTPYVFDLCDVEDSFLSLYSPFIIIIPVVHFYCLLILLIFRLWWIKLMIIRAFPVNYLS